MSTIRFELSKKTDDTQMKQILVRVSVSREFRVGGKTKMFISPKDWDEKTKTCAILILVDCFGCYP